MTTLRDEDITTTTNTAPGGDADQGDSSTAPGGDADQGDSNEQQVDPAGADPSGSDSKDADSSDS